MSNYPDNVWEGDPCAPWNDRVPEWYEVYTSACEEAGCEPQDVGIRDEAVHHLKSIRSTVTEALKRI